MDAVTRHTLDSGKEINLCLKCGLVVDFAGNPDAGYYTVEQMKMVSAIIPGRKCRHSKGDVDTTQRTSLYEQFVVKFYPFLGQTARWTAFQFIAEELLKKPQPIIVETGTLRQPNNWAGDGQSTRLWDWIAEKTGGTAVSTDIDLDYCRTAARLCPNVRVNQGDSVAFLRGYLPGPIDLLYLDAFDYSEGQEVSSMMHHAAELASAWDQLPSGCLVAIDDCHNGKQGKHALVKVMLDHLCIFPELTGYITIWRRP